MAATAADYLSADFPTEAQQPETVQSGEAPELGSTGMNYVFDLRGMLSDGEREELEDRAEDIALRRSCGIYTLFVEDFTAYGYGDDPYTALYQIYHAEGLGVGEDRNGVIIMLSMKERDYAMFVYGEWAEYAFDDTARSSWRIGFCPTSATVIGMVAYPITSPPAMSFWSWLRPENLCGPAPCRPSALRWQSPA